MKEKLNMERKYLNNINSLFDENTIINKDMNGKFFYFKCKICGKISSKRIYFKHGILSLFSLNCGNCNRKITNLKKFGVENPFQSEEIKQKIKDVIFNRYGVDNVNKLKDFRDKIELTRKERYGEHKELIVEKAKATFINHYGVDNPQKNVKIREKTKNTCLQRYGGVPNCFGSMEFYKSMKDKYGCSHALQVRDFRLKAISRYKYDDKFFDSSWELCVYIYLKDNNIQFEYHPFEDLYYEYEGKNYHYTPDFKINNKFIEIKGSQFFKNNELFNPYQNKILVGLKSIIENLGVEFWKKEDIQIYIDYVNLKYGKDYVKSFKFKNTN